MNAFGPYFGTNDEVRERVIKGAKLRFCPKNCTFLYPTEEEQNNKEKYKKSIHICIKHNNQRLYHGIFHPEIIAIKNCEHSLEI